jgi:hypothetical protein
MKDLAMGIRAIAKSSAFALFSYSQTAVLMAG